MSEFEEEFNNCLYFGFIPNEQQNKIIEHFKDWQPPKQLVEVPQCVDDAIKALPKYYSVYGAIEWIRAEIIDFEEEYEDWLDVYNWIFKENNANKFARAWLDGYTVEKEQLYYLCEKNTGYYLKKKGDILKLVVNPYFDEDNEFTQSEIDELHTGSYVQIPVEMSDNGI